MDPGPDARRRHRIRLIVSSLCQSVSRRERQLCSLVLLHRVGHIIRVRTPHHLKLDKVAVFAAHADEGLDLRPDDNSAGSVVLELHHVLAPHH